MLGSFPRTAAHARVLSASAWLAPLAAGAGLRLSNLHRQILLDDELHTVLSALYLSMRDILSTFKSEDPCLPLTAFYRALLELGVPFSEMTFRLPIVAVSLAAILVLPRLALPWIGRHAAILLAWLMALSPVLALYGGMVRPYAVVALLAPAATLALLRWREHGRLAWGLVYAVLAALCLWFHLGTAPFLAAAFGALLVEKAFARLLAPRWRELGPVVPSWRDLGLVGAAALLLVAAFVVPAWDSLRELYSVKSGLGRFAPALVPPIAHLQAGASSAWAVPLFWALVCGGLAVLLRARPAIAIHLAAVTLAQWAGLAVLAPIGLGSPIILNRYLVGTLPLVLLFAAVGLAAAAGRVARSLASTGAAALAALAVPAICLTLLAAASPFADPEFRRSSFRHGKDLLRFDVPRGRIAEESVPAFYRSEEVLRSKASIAEFPFRGGWSATRAHYIYQTVHGAPVLAIEPFDWPCDDRLRLRNHHCARPESLPASAARFLVVHRDPLAEELRIEGGDDSGNLYRPDEWQRMARISRRVARNLRRRWGPPAVADDRILAWDLDAVRSRLATAHAEAGPPSEPR